ncbi:STAS/SEC14 domain-containing protein [Robertkochia flava]|uniref:STAS/SEC14 domain-containing protein n=1 Tax=Robertkochia flava TaxID=3447986 RepID=UPI001CCF58E2|nr:STAS/SEC14 domain-containing protein [Robertkochia marina]
MNNFPPFPDQILNIEKIDIGTFYIYPKFTLGVVNEGVNLTLPQLSVLVALCERNYHLKNFVYISMRINSYSIDPTLYSYLLEMKNLKGIAVVTNKKIFRQNFQVEQVFYGNNMRIFNTVEEAVSWSNNLID